MKWPLVVLSLAAALYAHSPLAAQTPPQFALTLQGTFDEPRGMAVDSSGNVFVADGNNQRIQKFDSSGNFLLQWGSFGSGPGQFWGPWDIAVDRRGNVFVVEPNDNHRVQKFDGSGNFVAMWGSFGDRDGEFRNPVGIAVDATGNVYVADTENGRIQKFDSDGTFILKWSSPNGLTLPSGVAVDASRNVYVADNRCRIVKFDSVGTYLKEWPTLCASFDVAADSHGHVYVAEGGVFVGAARAAVFTSEGVLIVRWGSAGSGNGQFLDPRSIAVDAAGSAIYVSDFQRNDVQKLNWTPTAVAPQAWSGVKSHYR